MTGRDEIDPFAALGLPRRYEVAAEELERRFHERSRAVHPDRFARATPAERRGALERATRLNEAYRTLRDPWRRAEHLLALLEAPGAQAAPPAADDPAFLEEQLVAREELASARRRRDRAALEAIRGGARDALVALQREVARALATDAPDPARLRAARGAVDRARYHRATLDEAERALDPYGAWKETP